MVWCDKIIVQIVLQFWRGTLEQAQEEFQERVSRGEMTLVIEGLSEDAAQELPSEEDIESELQILLASGVSPSEVCKAQLIQLNL